MAEPESAQGTEDRRRHRPLAFGVASIVIGALPFNGVVAFSCYLSLAEPLVGLQDGNIMAGAADALIMQLGFCLDVVLALAAAAMLGRRVFRGQALAASRLVRRIGIGTATVAACLCAIAAIGAARRPTAERYLESLPVLGRMGSESGHGESRVMGADYVVRSHGEGVCRLVFGHGPPTSPKELQRADDSLFDRQDWSCRALMFRHDVRHQLWIADAGRGERAAYRASQVEVTRAMLSDATSLGWRWASLGLGAVFALAVLLWRPRARGASRAPRDDPYRQSTHREEEPADPGPVARALLVDAVATLIALATGTPLAVAAAMGLLRF